MPTSVHFFKQALSAARDKEIRDRAPMLFAESDLDEELDNYPIKPDQWSREESGAENGIAGTYYGPCWLANAFNGWIWSFPGRTGTESHRSCTAWDFDNGTEMRKAAQGETDGGASFHRQYRMPSFLLLFHRRINRHPPAAACLPRLSLLFRRIRQRPPRR